MSKKPIHITEHEGKKYGQFIDNRLGYACFKCCFYDLCLHGTISEIRKLTELTTCETDKKTYYKELK